jgi:predicted DNA-binding protein
MTRDEFPSSRRVGEIALRWRFGLRLDEVTSQKLEALTKTFHRSAAEVIRERLARATLEDLP